jgi:hypothetical protein
MHAASGGAGLSVDEAFPAFDEAFLAPPEDKGHSLLNMPRYESGPRFDTKYLNLQGTHTQLSKHFCVTASH